MNRRIHSANKLATVGVEDLPTTELISKFLASQGLPAETINDSSFQQLLYQLNPQLSIPSSIQVQDTTNRLSEQIDPKISPGMKEISVTFDVFKSEGFDIFLVFSVHFYHGSQSDSRKNMVYFKRMENSLISAQKLFETFREAIYKDHRTFPKITDIVISSELLAGHFSMDNSLTKHFICFNHHINQFASSILEIVELQEAVENLTASVRKIQNNEQLFEVFKKLQNSKNATYTLPKISIRGQRNWRKIAEFLAKCISLYDTFSKLDLELSPTTPFTSDAYMQLVYFNRIFQQCLKCSYDLSGPESSISQVMPAILSMKTFISNSSIGYPFESQIRSSFEGTFRKITGGELRKRYDMATLLDPRYGYRADIYPESHWTEIEIDVVNSILSDFKGKKHDAHKNIPSQLGLYKKYCEDDRLRENQDPAIWWRIRQTIVLSQLCSKAKELLVTPAVSVDASYYFGETGKFKRLISSSDDQKIKASLLVAQYEQEFRGSRNDFDSFESVIDSTRLLESSIPAKRARVDISVHHAVNSEGSQDFATDLLNLRHAHLEEQDWGSFVSSFTPSVAKSKAPKLSEGEEEEDLQLYQSSNHKQQRRRHCAICGKFEVGKCIKDVTVPNERLLLVLGAIHRDKINVEEARALYLKNRIVVCRIHFVQACSTIYNLLGVQNSQQLKKIPDGRDFETIQEFMQTIAKKNFSREELRPVLNSFLHKYKALTVARTDGQPDEKTACLCCGALGDSSEMIKMPDNAFEWAQWMTSLGIAFADLEQARKDNFLCRRHFPKESFTKRGRLLLGTLPRQEIRLVGYSMVEMKEINPEDVNFL